jgi:tetratricopeptide (TPR) repeat protein
MKQVGGAKAERGTRRGRGRARPAEGLGEDVHELFRQAALRHQAGDLPGAETLYRKVLRLRPQHAHSLHLLGLIRFGRGELDAAADGMEASIRSDGRHVDVFYNLGLVRHAQQRLAAAKQCYERALALKPELPEAWNSLGNLSLAENNPEDALNCYAKALELRPGFADAHRNLGVALAAQGRKEEAEGSYRRALALNPQDADTHNHLGTLLSTQARKLEAMNAYREAVQFDPRHGKAHYNLGLTLMAENRHEEAIAAYHRALELLPELADGHANLGGALKAENRMEEAARACERALELEPNHANAWNNLGLVRAAQGLAEEAIVCYERALELLPDEPKAIYNRGLARLVAGQFQEGWRDHEMRHLAVPANAARSFPQPQWLGEPLDGRRILLHSEQGLGDTLQMLRFVPLVRDAGGEVLLLIGKTLHRLARGLVARDQDLFSAVEKLPDFDLHCPLMSLPLAFGTTLETIPAESPYLVVPDEERAAAAQLPWPRDGLRVGLAWAGSAAHKLDRFRSLSLDHLAPLLELEGVRFFSLQLGAPAAQGALYADRLTDLLPNPANLADTAAKIGELDLVIAVDTALAHLSGALAVPTWVLLTHAPEWRWMVGREDSPWYPTMRLFRQPCAGDWKSVVEAVGVALRQLRQTAEGRIPQSTSHSEQPANSALSGHLAQGSRMQTEGDPQGTAEQFRMAIQIDPRCYAAWNGLGILFAAAKDWSTAQLFFEEACKLDPRNAAIHNNLANVLLKNGSLDAGLGSYEVAISLDSSKPKYRNNHGSALLAQGRVEAARQAFQSALALQESYPEAHANLGFLLFQHGDFSKAEHHYRRALALNPNLALAHFCLSRLLLAKGDFSQGWIEQEWRWRWEDFPSPRRHFEQAQWRGEDLAGKTILLHAEQGFGDAIQFVRYAALVASRGARVLLEVHPELVALMASLRATCEIVARGQPLPSFDLHCPLLSLPLAFSTTLRSVPRAIPYLHPPVAHLAWIQQTDRLKIGLVWAGSSSNTVDARRSIPLPLLLPILSQRADFYSLQHDLSRAEESERMAFAGRLPTKGDFAGTASAILQLDLVIAVDTAVAHLAGALGKPVWILLPHVGDWRWLTERSDNPWYPTARLFRQKRPGDWESVVAEVATDVAQMVRTHRTLSGATRYGDTILNPRK